MIKISSLDDIKEYALSLDSFLNPTEYKGRSAIEVLICRLILLEPSTIETHPDMGVGLISRFRGTKKNELSELDQEITRQITTYLPFVYGVQVKTSLLSKGRLRIAVRASDEVFALTYDESSKTKLTSEKITLDSFL